MIILPAIPAIVAALTPLAKAALVSAGIGAVVGGAACAVGGAVSGYHEQGELNRDVAIVAVQSIPKCAVEGAIVGGVIAPAGIIIGPVVAPGIAPIMQVVDDVARPVVQVVDDVASKAIPVVDDAASPIIDGADEIAVTARQGISRVAAPVAAPWNRALNAFRARIYKRLPVTKVGADDGWVYVIEDPVTGIRKIGRTSNAEQRLKKLQRDLGRKGVKFECIIHSHDAKVLEKHLHQSFSRERTRHPTPHDGRTEWFALSAAQVAAACSF